MTNIISVIPAYKGTQVSLKNLDAWLADIISQVNTLSGRVSELEKQNLAKDQTIANLNSEINALKLNKENSKTNQEKLWSTVAKKNSEVRMNIINVVADENKERNKKEKNIIVFGLEESKKDTITEKKEEDISRVNKICEALSLENADLEAVFRLNAKDKNKPKPLVMVLKNKETRNKFLYASKSLKSSDDYKSVFLCPDLTESQRLKYKELVKIRNEKNEKLSEEEKSNKIWCIRDNEVVLLKKKV